MRFNANKPWLLLGWGVSNKGAAKLMLAQNETYYVFCDTVSDSIEKEVRSLNGHIIEKHFLNFQDYSGVITSPGISPSHNIVAQALRQGVPVGTELDYSKRFIPKNSKVVAVTGTNGKSTVVSMISHGLNNLGLNATACGNIGQPLSDAILSERKIEFFVVEISSYQIEYLSSLDQSLTVITTLSQDHLERHKTFSNYIQIKLSLLDKGGTTLLLTHQALKTILSNNMSSYLPKTFLLIGSDGQCETISLKDVLCDDITLNLQNLLSIEDINSSTASAAISHSAGLPYNSAQDFSKYKPLPYRFEVIGLVDGHKIINDSKSTNFESTTAALSRIKTPCLLLVGGISKGETFQELRTSLKIESLILFGKSRIEIGSQLKDSPNFEVMTYENLESALTALRKIYQDKPCPILFSPGCASFDEFKNFEDRGRFFRDSIRAIFPEIEKALE